MHQPQLLDCRDGTRIERGVVRRGNTLRLARDLAIPRGWVETPGWRLRHFRHLPCAAL
jgi:hypothetical protein